MLSRREQDTYDFTCRFISQHGHGPLLTEVAAGLNIQSKGTAHRYIQAIAKKGLIELMPGRHRGICLPRQSTNSLPLLGKIAAGQPIEAIPDESEINLTEFFMRPNRFVLKVQGNSMIDAGILNEDMVIIEQCNRAENGDIVVALIDGQEATLKRIQYHRNGDITLHPANPDLLPITFAAERVAIQGIVVGQMRSYR